MSVGNQGCDIVEVVAGPGAGAEARRADVDGVGARVDGGSAADEVAGGRKKLSARRGHKCMADLVILTGDGLLPGCYIR